MSKTTRTHLNVLIIDDDSGAANALGRLLRAYGHTIHVSYSAVDGVDLATRISPDLVLLDITMPGMDGYEAARRLRAAPTLSNMVLIACSGSVDQAKARGAGFDGWLIKPMSSGDVETVLATVLQRLDHTPRSSDNGSVQDAPK